MRLRTFVAAAVGATSLLGMTAAQAASRTSVTPSIVLASTTGAARTAPALGGAVSFVTTYGSGLRNPTVSINCYQNGVFVWGDTGGTADSYRLGGYSSTWTTTGGSADCTAYLLDVSWVHKTESVTILATTKFTAQG